MVEDDFDNVDDFNDVHDFDDVDNFDVSPLFNVLRNDLDFFVVNALLFLYISNHCPAIENPLIVSQSSTISFNKREALCSVSMSIDNIDQ